jgi:hypothetical protein
MIADEFKGGGWQTNSFVLKDGGSVSYVRPDSSQITILNAVILCVESSVFISIPDF